MIEVSTFDDDAFELKEFSVRLRKFIEIEQHFVDGSLVIGLSSKFGSGKSSFLKMWVHSLGHKDGSQDPIRVVQLNAWESDYYGDPLFAIVSALIDEIRGQGESAENIIDAVKSIGWFATAIGGQIANKFTGVDPVAAGGFAQSKKAERENGQLEISDAFSVYESRRKAMLSLKEAISEYISSDNPKVLFVVDELDRCRPDYAISYLETIKHIFDIKGAVFILAADREHLKNSAKTAFGSDLDFEEYYRKFVNREVSLPKISDQGYGNLVFRYVDHYLQQDSGRDCYMDLDDSRLLEIRGLLLAFTLTPRQIQEIFRVLGHVLATDEEHRGRLLWCFGVGTILMSVLRIGAPRIYSLLSLGELKPIEAAQFFENLIPQDGEAFWWFDLCYSGGGLRKMNGQTYGDVLVEIGRIANSDEASGLDLGLWITGWGRGRSNRFAHIHALIEGLQQWR